MCILPQTKKKLNDIADTKEYLLLLLFSYQLFSPTLYDPMDYSTPGFPVPHHLPEFAQVHVQE